MMKNNSIFDKVESAILGLCIIGVISFIVQLTFVKDNEIQTFYNSIIEEEHMNIKEEGYIVLKKDNIELSKCKVIINGENEYKFGKKTELTLKVFNDDIIEIDGTMYDEPVEIRVVGISKNIAIPKLNSKTITNRSVEILSNVKINALE